MMKRWHLETVSASAESSVAWSASAKSSRTIVAKRLSVASLHLSACVFAAKEVELIDNVQHHIAGDGVVFCVAALHGRDAAT